MAGAALLVTGMLPECLNLLLMVANRFPPSPHHRCRLDSPEHLRVGRYVDARLWRICSANVHLS